MTQDSTFPAQFWDKRADAYAARPVSNPGNYNDTLDRTRAHLHGGMDVVELGCGTGSTALVLADAALRYTGTDFSDQMIRIARGKLAEAGTPNLDFETAALGSAQFDGCRYDAVLAFNLLHLIEDVPAALEDIRAMLPEGGLFISKSAVLAGRPHFRVLIGAMKLLRMAPAVSFFRAEQLEGWMRRAGFEIVETKTYTGAAPSHFVVARAV
ncbi:class I SAM-dependent methyltransferase [Anianabacter salinae]|uniref:class I SAM-dependent methyltransferase n=1 Tax=Anianabacter salinae TaxID=2851023 RepID=UPI00225E23FA|nr:class I SAM-dependent methyltransferase [Anianabacter salinae]MBV0914111.1 class I SAM-dependent methyltransferase [Anianabacter salinae]